MYQLRYGKPQIKDCKHSLLQIVILFIAGIIAISYGNEWHGAAFITVSVLTFLYILFPYAEWYYIESNTIHVKKLGKEYSINIPADSVLVISLADVHELFGHQSFLLSEKYAVSIIDKLPIQTVIDGLFDGYSSQYRYTNSTIERTLSSNFVYSFVFDKNDLERVLTDSKCDIVIPKSILDTNGLTNYTTHIYLDNRC